MARRWIAGVDLDTAISDAKLANGKGYGVVMNFLGEEISEPSVADSHVSQYLELQNAINAGGIDGFTSVKLTQFGLAVDESGAWRRLEMVSDNAKRLNQTFFMDMESSKFTDKTLEFYTRILERHPATGVAIQSYLKRSEADLKLLLQKGARVRLVKGAYREPADIVFPSKSAINESFSSLMKLLFDSGDNFAIATHDSKLVNEAKRLAEGKHVKFEFEMLKGIRNELKDELAKSGYRVVEYLPYGESWMAYSRRRMSEHPSNFFLLLRSLT